MNANFEIPNQKYEIDGRTIETDWNEYYQKLEQRRYDFLSYLALEYPSKKFYYPGSGFDTCGGAYVFHLLPDCIPQLLFTRGDGNRDGFIDIADPIYNLAYLFDEGPSACFDAQDTNDDGAIDVADPIYGLSYQFSNGSAPPEPFPGCGTDPTADSLGWNLTPRLARVDFGRIIASGRKP